MKTIQSSSMHCNKSIPIYNIPDMNLLKHSDRSFSSSAFSIHMLQISAKYNILLLYKRFKTIIQICTSLFTEIMTISSQALIIKVNIFISCSTKTSYLAWLLQRCTFMGQCLAIVPKPHISYKFVIKFTTTSLKSTLFPAKMSRISSECFRWPY